MTVAIASNDASGYTIAYACAGRVCYAINMAATLNIDWLL
jgi:hypothetical protein